MFDYNGFDPVNEEGFLRPVQVSKIKSALEDIIERIYDPCIVDEEVDIQIRKIADELGVYVPTIKKSRFDKFGPLYIEDVIREHICDPIFIYKHSKPESSISFLEHWLDADVEELYLSKKDIHDFCYSDFYNQKCMEAKCALKNV